MLRFLLVLTLSLFGLSLQDAHACSCAQGGYWVSEFLEDKIVFEGQVLQTKWLKNETDRPFGNNAETSFELTKSYNGKTDSNVQVQHHSQGPACGMFYIMGDKALVIGHRASGIITTSSCTSNAIPKITLLEYFENNIDLYIPSRWECPDEQIENLDDPKNCHFWSNEAAEQRRNAMAKRWRTKREAAQKNKKE